MKNPSLIANKTQESSSSVSVPNGKSFFKATIQPKLTINQPNDIYEQEADAVADKVMRMTDKNAVQTRFFQPAISAIQRKCKHCEEEDKKMQRKETSSETGNANAGLESYVGSLGSTGKSLPAEVRNFYEPRIGYDFSNVKIHTDATAAESARSVNALAYTSGNNIVFGNGQYSPDTDGGKRLLGHELAHVVQQRDTSVIARELSPSMCASDCTSPDNSNGAKGKFTMDVYADKEGMFLLVPATSKVGHSWLRLTDKNGKAWTYGFWPQRGFHPDSPGDDVEGCVHHPDRIHKPSASQTFELTEEEFNAAKSTAIDICNTKPKYNLFGLQCTSFVGRVLGAANKSPYAGFGLIWESPNALADWMKTNALAIGFKATQTTSLATGDSTLSYGAEAAYTRQFYSLLGNKLRLQWMASAEMGSKIQSVSTGLGVELNPQSVLLPSIYLYGGVTGGNLGSPSGDPGVGVKAGVGLNYNIDAFAFVKVEYGLVKDLVAKDSQLQQLSISAGLRFW